MTNLTEHSAYAAMFAFLEALYEATNSDDIGALLGSMSLTPSGRPIDPAIWGDWLEAIKKAESGNVGIYLTLRP